MALLNIKDLNSHQLTIPLRTYAILRTLIIKSKNHVLQMQQKNTKRKEPQSEQS